MRSMIFALQNEHLVCQKIVLRPERTTMLLLNDLPGLTRTVDKNSRIVYDRGIQCLLTTHRLIRVDGMNGYISSARGILPPLCQVNIREV